MGKVQAAPAASITVDTFTDISDANPGDGKCDKNGDPVEPGDCSLRAAIQEADATGAADTITLPAGTYDLTLDDLNINGAGGAITINGAGAATTVIRQMMTNMRVFDISASGTVVVINDVTITGGNLSADFAGGVWANLSANVTINDSIITGNSGSPGGGAGAGNGAIITINRSVLRLNTSTTTGGGIYNAGGIATPSVVNVNTSTISENTATTNGGGIFNSSGLFGAGTISVNDSTISENMAADGGGVYAGDNTNTTINNATISGNAATGNGGGIFKTGTGGPGVTLNYVTVANNNADSDSSGGENGGGIFQASGAVNIMGTIIGDNQVLGIGTDHDCSGTITSQTYNLIENLSAGCTFTPSTGDLTNTDPRLAPLDDYGGPTKTHALYHTGPISPAVDKIPKASAGCQDTFPQDQRGLNRADDTQSGSTCDMGGYELGLSPTVVSLGSFSARSTGWNAEFLVFLVNGLLISGTYAALHLAHRALPAPRRN